MKKMKRSKNIEEFACDDLEMPLKISADVEFSIDDVEFDELPKMDLKNIDPVTKKEVKIEILKKRKKNDGKRELF